MRTLLVACVIVAVAAALWGARGLHRIVPRERAARSVASATPQAEAEGAPPSPLHPPVEVNTRIDPADPELRAAVTRLGNAAEPSIDAIAVTTVAEAIHEYEATHDPIDLQTRLERILLANPREAARLHERFLAASEVSVLFVFAKVAAAWVTGNDLSPWIATAEGGDAEHRRMAMYALMGDRGRRSVDALVKAWSDPSAGAARISAAFVLESRIEDLPEADQEGVRARCRAEMASSSDVEVQKAAVSLLGSPSIDAKDRPRVLDLLAQGGDEGVRLAALRVLTVGGSDDTTSAALWKLVGDPNTPARLLAAAKAVLTASR